MGIHPTTAFIVIIVMLIVTFASLADLFASARPGHDDWPRFVMATAITMATIFAISADISGYMTTHKYATGDNTYYSKAEHSSQWEGNKLYYVSNDDLAANDKSTLDDDQHSNIELIELTESGLQASNATGAAYLRVTSYLTKRSSSIANVTINLQLDNTSATYDDSDGHHHIVCYAYNKKHHDDSKQTTVLTY